MTADIGPVREDRYAALRHPSFLKYWTARVLTVFATQIMSVAVGWQVYDLTRDPWDLGLVGLVQFLPAFLLVLVTGAAADRFGRRRIMAAMTLVETGVAIILLALTLYHPSSVLPIFAALLVLGIARAFYGPAMASLVGNLVPVEDYANAVVWNTTSWQVATIAGPMAGGLLYGLGAPVPYAVAALALAAAATLIVSIPRPAQHTETQKVSLDMVFGGFRYIWREKVVFGAISLDLFAVLLGGAVALMPVYARDILTLGPLGLGMMRSAPSAGSIVVAIFLSGFRFRDHAGLILLVFVFLYGASTVLFGASTVAWLSILALALIGATDMVSVYIRETLIQVWTPDHLRGRVNAVNMVFVGASNELGEFRAGSMASWIGTVPAVVFGGLGAMGVAVAWGFLFPALRRTRHLDGRT